MSMEATRVAYDPVAADYAALLRDHLTGSPVDRAVLGVFAELVLAEGGGPVLEVGCGPGRITAHLHTLGLQVRGTDLSPAMIAVARRDHPHLAFEVDDLTRPATAATELAGVVAWYSLIHTPPAELGCTLERWARALRPGGHLLLAFQVGDDEPVTITEAYGHRLDLVAYRLSPERMRTRLVDAGLEVRISTIREPDARERTQQAYLLARRPARGPRQG
jgi:SAM-dependent methyltransferase